MSSADCRVPEAIYYYYYYYLLPAVNTSLLDLGLVFSIYLRILDYHLSGSFNLCFIYRRQGINVMKTTFYFHRIEMGSYKSRKQ